MKKCTIYFAYSVMFCGFLQAAMTPVGRALVPQAPVGAVANNPAMFNALVAAAKKQKVNYVHSTQAIAPATALDMQKLLDQEVNKTLALRKSRVGILNNAIKNRYVNDMSYGELLLDTVVDVPLIKSALYAVCIDTVGCSADAAVRELNAMHTTIPGMSDWVSGTEAFPVIEELRNSNCRFNKLMTILHDNMGMLSLRNSIAVTGSTLDGMAYKNSLYPQLSETFRSYLVFSDEQEAQKRWPVGAETPERRLHSLVLNAIAKSKHSLQELSAVGNARAFREASDKDSSLIQRLKDYKMRVLYAGTDTPRCEQAIKLLNTLYDPHWMHDLDRFANDTDKFAHVDEVRGRVKGRGSLDEALSTIESGMKGVSFVEAARSFYKNLKGSTVDEIMYKTNMYPTLKQFWRDYLTFKDEQKWEQEFPDFPLDRSMAHAAIDGSFGNKQELSELENSLTWKNYLKANDDTSFLRQYLQEYKNKV